MVYVATAEAMDDVLSTADVSLVARLDRPDRVVGAGWARASWTSAAQPAAAALR